MHVLRGVKNLHFPEPLMRRCPSKAREHRVSCNVHTNYNTFSCVRRSSTVPSERTNASNAMEKSMRLDAIELHSKWTMKYRTLESAFFVCV